MAAGTMATLFEGLTSGTGAVLTGVGALCLVGLLAIASDEGGPGPRRGSPMAAMAQGAPAAPVEDKSGAFTPDQVKSLHAIIKDYLITNPEVIVDVTKELERRQAQQQAAEHERLIGENKARIFMAATDFVLGNPKGDISVVEFFDYNCGWCKRAVDDIVNLTKSDPKVRVVMKELPIFGEASTMAAKAAMASLRQGKYWEFHTALMREKQVTPQNLFSIAEKVGLNVARLKTDMADAKLDAALKDNAQIAQVLNIEGTPGFVIDSRVNVGYMPADAIRQVLSEIRKAGCKIC